MKEYRRQGFTLIELSIVLVIIGLIIGGVLVGRDLINTATIRSQISQIEKYNTVVNTFRVKYGYLPGDIPDPAATSIGLTPRGTAEGQGDGNGILEGSSTSGGGCFAGYYWACPSNGESGVFWADLAYVGLIGGSYSFASITDGISIGSYSGSAVDQFFPRAKIGNNNYVYVWSSNGSNFFAVAGNITINSSFNSYSGMTVLQAYAIDNKIDDGMPFSGNVTVYYLGQTGWNNKVYSLGAPGDALSVSPSDTTCADANGGGNFGTRYYSIGWKGGEGVNCALSFRFQ